MLWAQNIKCKWWITNRIHTLTHTHTEIPFHWFLALNKALNLYLNKPQTHTSSLIHIFSEIKSTWYYCGFSSTCNHFLISISFRAHSKQLNQLLSQSTKCDIINGRCWLLEKGKLLSVCEIVSLSHTLSLSPLSLPLSLCVVFVYERVKEKETEKERERERVRICVCVSDQQDRDRYDKRELVFGQTQAPNDHFHHNIKTSAGISMDVCQIKETNSQNKKVLFLINMTTSFTFLQQP